MIDFNVGNYDSPRWVVRLNNDLVFYRQDKDSWKNLKAFVQENSLSIEEMYLQFRSHVEFIGAGVDGFYFSDGAASFVLDNDSFEIFVAGVVDKNSVKVIEWRVPELTPVIENTRSLDDPKLIINGYKKTI